ncbi:putative zinc-binding protein [Eubacteriaceae bacterium ES3]|nr:putative zinc-binding protein [Eubacteriaceae bacterium ES3]
MKHIISPCPGGCNVSKMTNAVANHFEEMAQIIPKISAEIIESAPNDTTFVALNGCPAVCSSNFYKKFGCESFSEITIMKNFDLKNQKKYENLDNLEEEIAFVQNELNKI